MLKMLVVVLTLIGEFKHYRTVQWRARLEEVMASTKGDELELGHHEMTMQAVNR